MRNRKVRRMTWTRIFNAGQILWDSATDVEADQEFQGAKQKHTRVAREVNGGQWKEGKRKKMSLQADNDEHKPKMERS